MTNPAYEATNSDVEKVEKKKYPSDNYLNEILTNTEFAAVVPIEAVRCMARELMLLRTSSPNGMMQLSNELAEMKPVKLPTAWVEPGNRWLQERDVIEAIRTAGGTVEGGE
jgi:hypothetical protein